MKKLLALTLAMLCVLAISGCSAPAKTATTASTYATTIPSTPKGVFYFHFNNQYLVPGWEFPGGWLPEPVFSQDGPEQVKGSATKIYFYEYLQVTTYQSGNDEVIYSIIMLPEKAATIPTTEGLYFENDRARVEELYGTGAKKDDVQWVYTQGKTQLILQFSEDLVSGIEYREA